MFEKILIANRGEIALRIARTCRRLGIAVATVHSDADRDALHVREIGESVRLGPAPARESYLDVGRVVRAAQQAGADAVHPGYGFLSENAAFAEALAEAGIAFVGPSAQVLRDFGDKAAAKRLARAAGVPVLPGSAGASADAAEVAAQVAAAGYPVLLKAAAGGGGKGIRVLHGPEGLADAIAGAMREGLNAFGDAALLVERYLPHGRHVEVQILGDGRGGVRHLWERECSLQRRHQKVLEEAPALPLPAGLRERLLASAVALGRHVRYRALGTVEFLVAGDGFHFLEVNPRLQVEHPVTEAVTGLDLVELQLRAAAGEPLPQDAVRCDGHAIEVRLYAEDPAHGFVPSTGTLHHVELPRDAARVECGVESGSVVTPHYDPLLAKLVVHGATRAEAYARLREALARSRICGVAHNLALLEALCRRPEVVDAIPDTGTLDALLPALAAAPAPWRAQAAYVLAAAALQDARRDDAGAPASSWRAFTHWRLGAPGGCRPLHAQYRLQGEAGVQRASVGGAGPRWQVEVDGRRHEIELGPALPGAAARRVRIDGVAHALWLGTEGSRAWLSDGRHTEHLRIEPALQAERAADAGGGAALAAPLTGKVLEVRVADGDSVEAGQVLLVIESMKMEMRVTAPHAGVARAVQAAVGAMVERGTMLVKIEPMEAAA
jgi:3-methylcrotonyl-CoA carboxylase alpha subunit